MAAQGKTIKNKIASVKNIRKITKTMEMVSVAKMRRAIEKAVKSRAFTREAYDMLALLSTRIDLHQHHFFVAPPNTQKVLFVVIASNKGMCGGYNTSVSKDVRKNIKGHEADAAFITIGKQADKIASRTGVPIVASFADFSEDVSLDESLALSNVLLQEFATGQYSRIQIISTHFIRTMQYQVLSTQVLPVSLELSSYYTSNPTTVPAQNTHLFEPTITEVVDKVVPELVNAIIYQLLVDAFASEHSARMVAMKNATDSAGTLLGDLTLSYNQVRQANITQELSEIVAGASALQY